MATQLLEHRANFPFGELFEEEERVKKGTPKKY
jgi:hypothetical protein